MLQACRLPIFLAGALMPDAHVGYGLPIGGVLATDNSVIPYGVGVDIACRMKMSVLDWKPSLIVGMRDRLASRRLSVSRFAIDGLQLAVSRHKSH
jgi:tRNA-splicing ligase RtcB (3'-phosphate/5'-hydroxy nucleic acid ligase)